jgi:hypothetical protein
MQAPVRAGSHQPSSNRSIIAMERNNPNLSLSAKLLFASIFASTAY